MGRKITSIGLVLFLSLGMVGIWIILFVGTASALPTLQEGETTTPYPDPEEALSAAVNWLINTHQNADGGFASFSIGADQAPSDIGGTLDALLAIGAAQGETKLLLEYLNENVEELIAFAATDGGTAGKTVYALSLAGQDPSNFADHDFVVEISSQISPTGEFGVSTVFNQSLAILGLALSGESIPVESIDWIIGQQSADDGIEGSWDDGFGTLANADSTAMAIMALRISSQDFDSEEIITALDFLINSKLPTGGWEYGPGFGENANSIALVIQAAILAAEDIHSANSRWTTGDITPVDALLAWQSESGAFQADFGDGRFDDYFSTVQTIPALAMIVRTTEQSEDQELSDVQETTPTPTVIPELAVDDISTEAATETPATETATAESEPTEAPLPSATPEAIAETSADDAASSQDSGAEAEGGTGIASGDSILPYIIVGLVILIIIAFFGWLIRSRP